MCNKDDNHDHENAKSKVSIMKGLTMGMIGKMLHMVSKQYKPTNGSLDDPRGQNLEKFIEVPMPSAMYIFLTVATRIPYIMAAGGEEAEQNVRLASLFIGLHAMEDGIHPDWYDSFAVQPTQGEKMHDELKKALIRQLEGDETSKIPDSIDVVVTLLRR